MNTPGERHTPHHSVSTVPWWRSLVVRLVAVYLCVPALILALGVWRLHDYQAREVEDKFGLALQSIAASTAPHIDAADLDGLRDDEDAGTQAFANVRAVLEIARRQNGLEADQVYVVRPVEGAPGYDRLQFVAMLQRDTFIGDVYHPPPEIQPSYEAVMARGETAHTPLFTDAHGVFISGLAPIRDRRGRPVAVLQVDYGVEQYMAEVDRVSRDLSIGGALLFVALLGLALFVHLYMRRRFERVLEATAAISAQEYDYRIEARAADELGEIERALDLVIAELRERFEMLKFLPRHTARMIARRASQGEVDLEQARRVRVVVMESDIRGFTTLSEGLEPERVIRMLNTYVRLQAELVEEHGGSIDKYMGDAVLAVFEGPDMERDALACVLAIQREVERANARGAFDVPVHIGVGLSVGEVVMGNMGSERRMEHTVIGSVVNLAARLCSAARAGEIVMTDAFADPARALGCRLPAIEPIVAKGFAEPVRCYRLVAVDAEGRQIALCQEGAEDQK